MMAHTLGGIAMLEKFRLVGIIVFQMFSTPVLQVKHIMAEVPFKFHSEYLVIIVLINFVSIVLGKTS